MSPTYRILVGSYTRIITTLSFTPSSKDSSSTAILEVSSSLDIGDNPSWISQHPSHPNLIFATLENPKGQVALVKVDDTGKGHVEGYADSGGDGAVHLWIGEQELVVANYFGSTILQIPFTLNPPRLAQSPYPPIQFQIAKPGPNKERQDKSHPHQIYYEKSRDEIFVPDLGADKIRRLVRSSDDKTRWVVNENESIDVKSGSGPRHVLIKDNILYIVAELTSELITYSLDSSPKHLKTLSTLSTPPSKDALASEIIISTSGYHILVANRNSDDPRGDPIAVFTPHPKFERVGEIWTGLKHGRGMQFSKNGKYLIAGGVNGGGVKVYEWTDSTGSAKEIAKLDVEKPTDFVWV
ncbi:3-carboxy-cis,cis-mucoante lactonizing enzyme [Sistotremastrum niveocremeum HHB9708]|uniref:3-carboxy-cis,cis-mucoante lactonizing enzyme n=1 Tax=Sistotremastrum niveocremeum HHB9708 TaxID=1314777 RepID=A0A164Y3Z2_9AGAM|nr:3-carboxy-cis,cis-mucoante lactonizing enzyme [Sistotremastrum niveocremeum HHB9708]